MPKSDYYLQEESETKHVFSFYISLPLHRLNLTTNNPQKQEKIKRVKRKIGSHNAGPTEK